MTIAELKEHISKFNDEDIVVVEIHEGERNEDLYPFTIDSVELNMIEDNDVVRTINEVRICI